MLPFILALLLFVLSIPGTNALRYVLAFTLLVLLSVIYYRNSSEIQNILKHKQFRRLLLGLIVITIYILLHIIFVSHDMFWSIKEYKGHWIVPLLFFIVGVLLASVAQLKGHLTPRSLMTTIFFGMFLHIVYVDIVAIDKLIQGGTLISRYGGLTDSPVLANYLTNILLVLSAAEWVTRHRTGKKVLVLSNELLYLIFVLLILSTFIEGMRHGVVSLAFTGLATVFFYLYNNSNHSKRYKGVIGLLLVLLFSTPLAYNLKYDQRWQTLLETIPIALDTDSHKFWQGDQYDLPRLASGHQVSASNYQRMAWIKKGVEYIAHDPVGIGFGRNAFGHAVQMYENEDLARGKHAHSSIIDFTVGVGIVGLIMWLIVVSYVIIFFLRSFKDRMDFYSMSGALFVSGFFFRSMVDSNMRDHIFQQFFLILGVILVLLIFEQLKSTHD